MTDSINPLDVVASSSPSCLSPFSNARADLIATSRARRNPSSITSHVSISFSHSISDHWSSQSLLAYQEAGSAPPPAKQYPLPAVLSSYLPKQRQVPSRHG